jgi:hypothetical protein
MSIPVTFWVTSSYTYSPSQVVNSGAPYNYALVNDGCGDGGFIGYGFTKIGASSAPLPWVASPYGEMPDDFAAPLFGTWEQQGFTLAAGSTVNGIRQRGPFVNDDSYGLSLDFSTSKCTKYGALKDGSTFGGTIIGFSDFFAGKHKVPLFFNSVMTFLP